MIIALIGEDATHAALVDRWVRWTLGEAALETPADVWIHDSLAFLIEWAGAEDLGQHLPGVRYTRRGRTDDLPSGEVRIGGRPIKTRGFINGRSLAPEAGAWRRALLYVLAGVEQVDAVICARDTDGDPARLVGVRQAASLIDRPVLICAPHQDAEAWIILGMARHVDPDRRAAMARALGFDPIDAPERLTAQPNSAPTDAKRVLSQLRGGAAVSRAVPVAQLAALIDDCRPPADVVARVGPRCGLADFIEQVRARLLPLLRPAGHARR